MWRAVEAQHVVSTVALTDTLDEQRVLEELLDGSKPPVPRDATRLHYLLFTPFRYPPSPWSSRFRGPADPGVFYGADECRTACAELGYWRWRFLRDAPALAQLEPRLQTLFVAAIDTTAVDLRKAPFARDRRLWTHPERYDATQAFARVAREAKVGAIRYASVRDPEAGGCVAVLVPSAFARRTPLDTQSWWLTVSAERVVWRRDSAIDPATFEFRPG